MNTEQAVQTYESLRAFAGGWGIIFFGLMFLGVLVYAFWPSRKKSFDDAAEIPFREDDDDVSGHV